MRIEKALFGTALFLSRPYPPPQDIAYILSFIHSRLPHLIHRFGNRTCRGKKALSYFREICHSIFSRMHDKPNFWKSLDKDERLDLAWYLFVPIWQMAGRLVRGRVPAHCCTSTPAMQRIPDSFLKHGINCLNHIKIIGFIRNCTGRSCHPWKILCNGKSWKRKLI